MKPKFSHLISAVRVALFGLGAVFFLPEPIEAQQRYTGVEVQLSSGSVYQGGRKSKRGIKLTTSSISLPDLNAILAPTPKPRQQAPVPQVQVPSQQAAGSGTNQGGNPRFGFGSGPVQPPQVDPRVPVDPGYDSQPPVPNATVPRQQVVPQQQPQRSSIQIQQTTTIPFIQGYYPRTYLPRVPFVYQPFSYGVPFFGGHHNGCGIFNSRAPLRGSLTSSRNYLSGFNSFRVSF